MSNTAKKRERDAFNHGYLIAVSTLLHQHGSEVEAEDLLRDCGLSFQDATALGLDDFDLDVLLPRFEHIGKVQP